MSVDRRFLNPLVCLIMFLLLVPGVDALHAQEVFRPVETDIANLKSDLGKLHDEIKSLEAKGVSDVLLADVTVYAKAVEWIIRHDEFYSKGYVEQASTALATGRKRAESLASGSGDWSEQRGTKILGYKSRVDGSVQPYALSLPTTESENPAANQAALPLHVVLHGRAGKMNEVNFIHRYDNKPTADGQHWVQLDVFGRTNNAYRWSGETDVFEAIDDVQRRFKIDDDRIVLRGFSMGGAGSWHLGMHHPHRWVSVGPGAGFVDFYKYQKKTTKLEPHQHATLGIYDSIDYALNAFNVPVCTYGGEKDSQLMASTSMVQAAKELGVGIDLIVGPNMGHKFDPESRKKFMAFHTARSRSGRLHGLARKRIRFTTRTLKYNACDWVTLEEMGNVYEEANVEAEIKIDRTEVSTKNVRALTISSAIHGRIVIDGTSFLAPRSDDDLLFLVQDGQWILASQAQRQRFERNEPVHKRHNLQGPIDDAFMEAFVCVQGSGSTASAQHDRWTKWTLHRFETEFDKNLRGRLPIVNDTDLTLDMIRNKNLILFGDPSSNSVLAKVVAKLPIEWDDTSFVVDGKQYSTSDHGLTMIYPNPMNPKRYVVINAGHTFHQPDFQASNAWLFSRLGDIAVQKFSTKSDGSFDEEVVFARIFDANWR